jgi:hypothetical protein
MSEIVDSHLERHLHEIERIAAKAGATGCLLLSHAQLARLFYDVGNGPAYVDLTKSIWVESEGAEPEEIHLAVILLFPKATGGFRNMEAKILESTDEQTT